ncbi:MAG: hypothetical protein NTX76_06090 [Alphaproteobacteria bacterium]|nr:hypothetical protein [Alphaproteobacteria bacterium]
MDVYMNQYDLQAQLQQFQQKQQQLDVEMLGLEKGPAGIADFAFYYMRKQKEIIQEQIIKINTMLCPDIIA